MAGNHSLGTIRGTIEIDYDGAGIVKAIKDTDRAGTALGKMDVMSSKALKGFSSFGKGALAVTGAIGGIYNVLTAVTATLAAVGPIAAAGFAAAPGAILGFQSALAITKIAVMGVGDALSAAGEDTEKFNKAIEKLSPEAKEFAKAFRAAYPALEDVKNQIQDTFFRGTSEQVGRVVDRIASLAPQARGVAGAMSDLVVDMVQFALSNKSLMSMRQILSGVTAFLLKIRESVGPVIQAFIGLAAQSAKFGGVVGGKVADGLAKLAEWLNQIDVVALFEKAMPIVAALGELFSNLGTIASELFGMFNVDGASSVSILSEMVSKLAEFLQSAQGQEALDALGVAIQTIAGASGEIFLALLQALVPVIVALAPGIAQLATQLSAFLVPALAALSPLLTAVAGYLSENMSWITPLIGGIVALAAAYKVYAAGAAAVAAVQSILAASVVRTTAAFFANTASLIANRVAQVALAIASGVVRAAVIAWTAVQWLLNVALTANPIGVIIILIAAMIAAVVLLWKNNETFRNHVLAVWALIKIAIKAVVDWVTGTLVPSFQRAWNQLVSALKWVANIWAATWNGVVAVFRAIWNAIVSYVQTRINMMKAAINKIKEIVTIFRNAFNNANNAVKSAINNVISTVKGLPGRVVSALGNIGRLLYNKGVSLVQGFISGIAGMIGRVRDAARRVVSAVTDFLPGSPAKEGPLSGRGYALLRARRMMGDFAEGLKDGASVPVSVMLGAVTPMSRAMAFQPSTGRSGGSATGTTPTGGITGNREYNIAIGDRTFAKLVVDALTGAPVAVSKAASEGSRQSAWTGSGRKS